MADRLDRIDKLLRLSENNPDEAEADTALRKAAEQMRIYLDESKALVASKKGRPNKEDNICNGCGKIRPAHKKDCLTAKIEKRMVLGGVFGCFSCSGLLFIWFLSAIVALFQQLFG